jgi:site-specific DNA-methyltransferase (adenine-specific)
MTWQILEGDCVERMRDLADGSVDAVVTDPPYSIEFMGKGWDTHVTPEGFQAWCRSWALEALRVLKPGGHLLAFGGTRTSHRLVAGVEEAGFEIRDTLAWLYGSGFPKSHDVSKAIDKAAGVEREVVGSKRVTRILDPETLRRNNYTVGVQASGGDIPVTTPATEDAARWQGWGTALKPAYEPVVVARKPLQGTVAANVLARGTGALNIDGCRIETDDRWQATGTRSAPSSALSGGVDGSLNVSVSTTHDAGRWPANVLLDEDAAAQLDAQSGDAGGGFGVRGGNESGVYGNGKGYAGTLADTGQTVGYGDAGGASRFFYCAKASSAERNAGLDDFPAIHRVNGNKWTDQDYRVSRGERPATAESGPRRNVHPTVKPVELMRWLVRLVTPAGGVVLDPFVGSGTTGCAALLERFAFVGIERDPEYAAIARARLAWWAAHPDGITLTRRLEAEAERERVAQTGQLDIFGGSDA